MATQFSDMSLGGTSFGAGYTPIRFAPLVSLTGPITAPAPPAAPEAPVAPMMQAPMMPTMAEMPDNAYMTGQAGAYPVGMPPFGARTSEQIRGDLMNIGGFFMSPISSMLNYVMTGQKPGETMQAMFGGAQGQRGQGIFSGVRDFINNLIGQGGQPAGAPTPQGYSSEMGFSVANDAYQMALSSGADEQAAMNAANSAASLVAQGVDPITAATISAQYAIGAAGPQMPEMPAAAPVAPTPTQTFAVQTGGGYAPSDFGGISGVTEGFGSPGSVADVSGGQAPY